MFGEMVAEMRTINIIVMGVVWGTSVGMWRNS